MAMTEAFYIYNTLLGLFTKNKQSISKTHQEQHQDQII